MEGMDVALIAEQRDLGVPARVVPLDGLLPLPSGAKASTTLVQTDRGVWLLASDGMESAARALSRNPTCRYEPRLVGDRLHADGLVFGVPMGRGAEVRMALGAGRLLANATHRSEHLPHGSFAEAPGDLAEVWLSTFLEPDELPLAWLQSSDRRGVRSDLLTEEAELRYLLTSARHALVSLNSVGDVQVLGLDPLSLEVEGARAAAPCGLAATAGAAPAPTPRPTEPSLTCRSSSRGSACGSSPPWSGPDRRSAAARSWRR